MAECMIKETQVPSAGSCKKSKSLTVIWKHGLWERSKTFYPVALPRYKRDKVQGKMRASSVFQVFLVIKQLCSERSLLHLGTALCCPQGIWPKPKGLPVEVYDSCVPRCGAPVHTKV